MTNATKLKDFYNKEAIRPQDIQLSISGKVDTTISD